MNLNKYERGIKTLITVCYSGMKGRRVKCILHTNISSGLKLLYNNGLFTLLFICKFSIIYIYIYIYIQISMQCMDLALIY